MKICDLTQSYTPTSGGVKTYIEEKRSHILKSTDWEHVLVVPGEHDEVEHDGRITVHRVDSPFIPGCEPYRIVLRLGRVISILEEERPDIIELGCPYTLPWAAFRHARTHACRIAGFYHTDFPNAYIKAAASLAFGEPAASSVASIFSRYARLLYSRCDITLAPSFVLTHRLQRYGIRNAMHMPLGVDIDMFHPSKRNPSLRTSLGIGPNELMIVYAGRLDSEKRVNIPVEAMRLLPAGFPAKLVLAGEGPLKKTLAREADDRILLLPYISGRGELAEFLASGDIYITAGPHETFGLSVLEAQASGLPVIGVRAGALKERVYPSTGLLGPVDDPAAMARNIMELAENDHKAWGLEARRKVERSFSWHKTFERLFSIYRDLMTRESRSLTQNRASVSK